MAPAPAIRWVGNLVLQDQWSIQTVVVNTMCQVVLEIVIQVVLYTRLPFH